MLNCYMYVQSKLLFYVDVNPSNLTNAATASAVVSASADAPTGAQHVPEPASIGTF